MQLPLGFGRLDFGNWLYGLFSGVISGGAGAVVTGLAAIGIDPSHFNLSNGSYDLYKIMTAAFLINGILAGMNYLAKNPLPAILTERTVEKTMAQGIPTVVVETKKETMLRPADQPPPLEP